MGDSLHCAPPYPARSESRAVQCNAANQMQCNLARLRLKPTDACMIGGIATRWSLGRLRALMTAHDLRLWRSVWRFGKNRRPGLQANHRRAACCFQADEPCEC